MALRMIKALADSFSITEQVPLLDASIEAALLSFDRSLLQSFIFTSISIEVLERQGNDHALSDSHRMTELDPFIEDPTV